MNRIKTLIGRFRKNDSDCFDQDFLFDPASPEFIADPYPILTYLRENQPVHRGRSGAWVLTRYEDVSDALSNPNLGNTPATYAVVNKRNREKYCCASVANNILPFQDCPVHSENRKIISRSYFKFIKRQSNLQLTIEDIAKSVLQEHRGKTQIDVIHDFGTAYTGRVICSIMGLPVTDLPKLVVLSELFLYLFMGMPSEAIRQEVDKALEEFRDYFKELVSQKRKCPSDDWVSVLICDNDLAASPLSELEIIDTLMLFFSDGVENVDRLIGTLIWLLVSHPKQYRKLKRDNSLSAKVVEEVLRFESPVQYIGRVATKKTLIGQTQIKANESVLLMLGGANRDPAKFQHSNKFDLNLKRVGVLAFGRGSHSCLGKALVKQQLNIALQVLLNEFSDIKLLDREPNWEARIGHRWLKSCQVELFRRSR